MAKFRYQHGDRPLEGYTIQHGLGRGGFGEVYFAVSDSGRHVAIKAVQNYEEIELRGIAHCMNLKNAHLVSIFDVRHNEQDEPFVIMEYIDGPSLRDLLDQAPGGLGEAKTAFFLREIAKGLTYLHDRGVVHRDLKPHNVFYEDGVVKIGDYSLSKVITTSHRSGHTVTVGTVHYMAPEISLGRYDSTVDIYALGVILYEMLTGQPPFVGETMAEVLMRHLSSEVDVSKLPRNFQAVVRRALAKDPADRYQSAEEMTAAVFGCTEVSESVTALAAEGLSVIARRATRSVPELVSPDGRGGDDLQQTAFFAAAHDTGISLDVGGSVAVGDHVKTAARQFASSAGLLAPGFWNTSSDPSQADDTFDHSRRVTMSAVGICLVAMATAMLSDARHSFVSAVVTQMSMAACAGMAILVASRKLSARGAPGGPLRWRLALGFWGCLGLGAGMLLADVIVSTHRWQTDDTWFATLLPMLILDWRAGMAPARPQRVGLPPTLLAGILGAVFGNLQSVPVETAGLLASVALCLQMASPWDSRQAAQTASQLDWQASLSYAWNKWLKGTAPTAASRGVAAHQTPLGAEKSAAQPMHAPADSSAASASTVISPHSRLVALVLSLIVPFSGLHRFYVGKWFTGLLWFLTGGLAMIGQVIDIVSIALGAFHDSQGRLLLAWGPGDAEEVQQPAAQPVNAYSTVPRASRVRERYWRPRHGLVVLALGAALLGVFAALANAVIPVLATMAQAGVFDPLRGIQAEEWERMFGTNDWPIAVMQLTRFVGTVLGLVAVSVLLFTRHRAGWWHMSRVLLATVALVAASQLFSEQLARTVDWQHISQHVGSQQWGPIVTYCAAHTDLMLSICTAFAMAVFSILLLAWPQKMTPAPDSQTLAPEVDE